MYPQYIASDFVVVYSIIPTSLTSQPPHLVASAASSRGIIPFVDLLLLLISFQPPHILLHIIHTASPTIERPHPLSTVKKIAKGEKGECTDKILHATKRKHSSSGTWQYGMAWHRHGAFLGRI